jgi:hypothetical protein
MTLVFILLSAQALLGAFDNLWGDITPSRAAQL